MNPLLLQILLAGAQGAAAGVGKALSVDELKLVSTGLFAVESIFALIASDQETRALFERANLEGRPLKPEEWDAIRARSATIEGSWNAVLAKLRAAAT